jgi:hypothetical protein
MTIPARLVRRSTPVMLAVACGLVAAAPAAADFAFVAKWGGGGSGDGQFRAPYGVATGPPGNVYVTDFGNGLGNNDRVEAFTSTGGFVTKWGSLGAGDTEFHDPWGIAADGAGNVFVADTANNSIKKFTSGGLFLAKIGGPGSGPGQFSGLTGVAVDSGGNIYATDHSASPPATDRIEKFVPDALAPCGCGYAFSDEWGVPGSLDGQFNTPRDVATDTAGNVYVTDYGNERIQKFDSSGFFLKAWGGHGTADGQLAFPEGLATDSAGSVYVADRANNRIQKFDSSGGFITKWGTTGNGDGQFSGPSDVAVDASGNVYVADTGNDRIQKFAEAGAPPGGGGSGGGVVPPAPAPAPGGGLPSNAFTVAGVKVSTRDGRIKYQLVLPGPGAIEVTATARVTGPPRPPALDPNQRRREAGPARSQPRAKTITVATRRATIGKAGTLTVTLTPGRTATRYLRYRALRATVKITYTPAGGTARSTTRSATFKIAHKLKR